VVVCALVRFVFVVSKQVVGDQVIWCFVNSRCDGTLRDMGRFCRDGGFSYPPVDHQRGL
jgi:hypothetical protein